MCDTTCLTNSNFSLNTFFRNSSKLHCTIQTNLLTVKTKALSDDNSLKKYQRHQPYIDGLLYSKGDIKWRCDLEPK